MKKVNQELKNLYNAYIRKRLCPETALEIASAFILDLINVFGDNLNDATPLKQGWRQFSPFEFIIELNTILARYKENGLDDLDDVERSLLADNSLLIGSIIRAGIDSARGKTDPDEVFQIPQAVADDLEYLVEK
jgi:hypothetical protein